MDRLSRSPAGREVLAGRGGDTGSRVVGLGSTDGALLWECPWKTEQGINVAQPIVLQGKRIIVSAGFDHGAAAFDVTVSPDGFSTQTVWENRELRIKFSSSVEQDEYVYGFDEESLVAIDTRTGEVQWKVRRFGMGHGLQLGDWRTPRKHHVLLLLVAFITSLGVA